MTRIGMLRAVSFLLGCALVAAPAAVLVHLSYLFEARPPRSLSAVVEMSWFVGCAMGGGLLLAAIPKLVVGASRPWARAVAGTFIVLSALAVAAVGSLSTIWLLAAAPVLAVEAVVFYVLVFPARGFVPCLRTEPTPARTRTSTT